MPTELILIATAAITALITTAIIWPIARSSGYDAGQRAGAAAVAYFYQKQRRQEQGL